jgi:hypothetical protein
MITGSLFLVVCWVGGELAMLCWRRARRESVDCALVEVEALLEGGLVGSAGGAWAARL